MASLNASLKLRPTRIGFLVRPSDRTSLSKIMRLNSCLWGGIYNPIIPVCGSLPKLWKEQVRSPTGPQLTRGYLNFFEPDVYVEASPGLASSSGLPPSFGTGFERRVVPLDEFACLEEGEFQNFFYGLGIYNLYQDLYDTEHKFVRKHPARVSILNSDTGSGGYGFAEAAFGAFPSSAELLPIETMYRDVFDPQEVEFSVSGWLKSIKEQLVFPLNITRRKIETHLEGHGDYTLFIVNPESSHDLIDLWNVRLFERNVLPININWIGEVKEHLCKIIESNHRPLRHNKNGVMTMTTLEFARSIPEELARATLKDNFSGLPNGSWSYKPWYQNIWHQSHNEGMVRPSAIELTSQSKDLELLIEEQDQRKSVRFRSISPDFAEQYDGHNARWANVLRFEGRWQADDLALVLPFNSMDADLWNNRSVHNSFITSEGLVLLQDFKDFPQSVEVFNGQTAITKWLSAKGIMAEPSAPGRNATQMLKAVGGIRGARLLADSETIKLLDFMARSRQTNLDGSNETTADRVAPVARWQKVIGGRRAKGRFNNIEIENFVKAGAIRLGLSIDCPECSEKNWYGLADLNDEVTCGRCLESYDFPQGSLNFGQKPWKYRVIGPFSVPNYADGAYSTILSLRTFLNFGMGHDEMTYTTNLNLTIDGKDLEIDFAFWYRKEKMFGAKRQPTFVVGESKSYAKDAFTSRDIERMKYLCTKIPGTTIVFSSLKEELSKKERDRIGRLALWGRVPLPNGGMRAEVIVLTGTELFCDWSIAHDWQEKGGKRAELIEPAYVILSDLSTVADLTQQVYLGLSSYGEWRREYYEKKWGKGPQNL
jgi:hypothetical protein